MRHHIASHHGSKQQGPAGFTLVEILAIVTVLGIVALVAIPRLTNVSTESKKTACYVNQGDIEVQIQLYYRSEGTWPLANLSDIGADPSYFPEGLPICPVDGSAYTMDAGAHTVLGHAH